MAKVIMDELIKGFRGAIGGWVFRQMPDGSVLVSMAPHYGRRRKYSKKQKEHQNRFKEAIRYARHAARTQPVYAELARGTVKSAYNFAISDWWNPPVIHQIRHGEKKILVEASDNVMVANVQVTILGEEGKVLEKGEATHREGNWWEYAPQLAGIETGAIAAEARDLAGNVCRFAIE